MSEAARGLIERLLVLSAQAVAGAIKYALVRWPALTRYRDDGRIEIDNNSAERSIRPVVLGRRNYLFAGSDAGDHHRSASSFSAASSATSRTRSMRPGIRAAVYSKWWFMSASTHEPGYPGVVFRAATVSMYQSP